MLRVLDYQENVLKTLDAYLAGLSTQKQRADRIANLNEQDPTLDLPVLDFPGETWKAMKEGGWLPLSRANIDYSARHDGVGRPVPNVVFKVPTGGGKTYLAVNALSRIFGSYLGKNTGFVLWIVPNEAIYSQTLKQLNDRQHPYRQMLDRISAGRVRILEKTDTLNAADVDGQLCVMLLMLQSANRQTRESLKLFQDRGDVHGFFPPEGDQAAHQRAFQTTPNLDAYDQSRETGTFWPYVKDSLGNALRVIRPVVVMDEGHHATPDLAFQTLYGFNPSFVLELSATPKDVASRGGREPRPGRHANILVEVTGVELDKEGMIKMPLNLDVRQGTDWRTTLRAAHARLDALQRHADQFRAESSRFIRPIMLLQVERTGIDQRDGTHIHTEDVRDWLRIAGFSDDQIAVKTASENDLSNPENQDLLSETNRVRVIITKQALQEGWDCPFAYVLCSLAASSSLSAMTQLVGRILRQPHAQKTGIDALDESYVIAHHAATADVFRGIKSGLERDGLGDLVQEIAYDSGAEQHGPRSIHRRQVFQGTDIYLPKVLTVQNGGIRDLDYESDVLYRVEWYDVDLMPLVDRIPLTLTAADSQMTRIHLTADDDHFRSEAAGKVVETRFFDPAYATRMIADIVPNPWIARAVVAQLLDSLKARGFTAERIGASSGLLIDELRKHLTEVRDQRAEELFREELTAGSIQFRLRFDARLDWEMPRAITTSVLPDGRRLRRNNDEPLQLSLFEPVFEEEFDTQPERQIAVHLDEEKTIRWWHRNVARKQYALQGWKRERVYPDFIFAINAAGDTQRIAVVETKGEHLAGNEDSEYKRALLQTLTEHFERDAASHRVGILEVTTDDRIQVECEMITLSDWGTELPRIIQQDSSPRGGRSKYLEGPYPVRHLKKRKNYKNGVRPSNES